MRTVTLEFLRHGSPHGHLLSPLARYMALCGSHEPADVSVPFDHVELLSRLRALDYLPDQKGQQADQLASTAKLMSEFLAQVPGLVAELADSGQGDDSATHLRIIFNASELAILPFELANSAKAFPGAGQALALQPQVPICITREVRRPSSPAIEWPRMPRILFAWSSAGGAVPSVEHQRALEAAIEPWLFHHDPGNEKERQARIDEHLRVIPEVTVEQLLEACACGEYTHIHLLAHGLRIREEERQRYALSLTSTDPGTGPQLVDGPWLASIMRPQVKDRIQSLARPTVVTLCVCNSGDARVGIAAGSSIAHALHEAGIPLVIGSQFPLSMPGSVVLTQVLYESLLAGIDPRLVLIDVRRQLRTRAGMFHDWASLVVYASFPPDIDSQLPKVRLKRASRSVEAALNHADRMTRTMSTLLSGTAETTMSNSGSPEVLETAKSKLRAAMTRMKAVLDLRLADKSEVYGLMGSGYKRKAEILLRASAGSAENTREVLLAAEESLRNYRNAFDANRGQAWALVQCIVLTAALDGANECRPDDLLLARLLSVRDAEGEDRQRKAWARGNLLELGLLYTLRPDLSDADLPGWETNVEELLRSVGPEAAEVHSTRRQLQRWVEFFPEVHRLSFEAKKQPATVDWRPAMDLARQIFERMPEPSRFS